MPPEGARRVARVTLDATVEEPLGGALDRVYETRVTGWAWDRRAPSTPVEVEILVDGAPIARGLADRLREDLAQNGVGDGRHAFDIRVERPLPVDAKHRVSAAVVEPGSERRVELLNREAPKPRAAGPQTPVVPIGAIPEALGRWLDEFRVVQASLENALIGAVKQVRTTAHARLSEVSDETQRFSTALESLVNAQGLVARQIQTLETVQARIDEALASVREAEAERPRRDAAERWLKRVVAFLSLVSLSALGLGIYSLLR
ncbi:MAG: hypothetical protein JNK67_08480 [Alphaproteobacteria bacterium]|nr:hypothetical protein [Alphaproteobacteria bacterium]